MNRVADAKLDGFGLLSGALGVQTELVAFGGAGLRHEGACVGVLDLIVGVPDGGYEDHTYDLEGEAEGENGDDFLYLGIVFFPNIFASLAIIVIIMLSSR